MKKINKLFGIILVIIFLTPISASLLIHGARDYTPRSIHLSWQMDPTTTMTVSWRTEDSTDSVVQYGLDSTYGNEEPGTEGYWHHIGISGLTPDTTYHYRVGNGKKWSLDYTFKTLSTGDHSSFVGGGDSQDEGIDRRHWVTTVDRVATDFLLFSGDFVDTSTAINEYYSWLSAFSPILVDTPILTTLGNHEKNRSIYYQIFKMPGNGEYYSIDLGPIHLVSLHTYYEGFELAGGDYNIQANWLINDLEDNLGADWIVVMMHRPPFSSYPRNFEADEWYKELNETFVPIFEYYNVDVVLTGHEHGYERLYQNGVNYIISGGAGSTLYNPNPSQRLNTSVYIESTFNFNYWDVTPNKLYIRANRVDYSLIDELIINNVDEPDLTFETLPLIYKGFWNDSIQVEQSVVIKNTGEQNIAQTTNCSLTISQEPYGEMETAPEPTVQYMEIPALDVNETYTLDFVWNVTNPTSYTYTFDLDTDNTLNEVEEQNNQLVIKFVKLVEVTEESSFIFEGFIGFFLLMTFLILPAVFRKRREVY